MTARAESSAGLAGLAQHAERVCLLTGLLADTERASGRRGLDAALRAVVLHRLALECSEIARRAEALAGEAQDGVRAEGSAVVPVAGGEEWWTSARPVWGPVQHTPGD